jgi:hypothetical protein
MNEKHLMLNALLRAAGAMVAMSVATVAMATEPCGDLGECKALVEINSSDGDIGFHFLMDGDDLQKGRLKNPSGFRIFKTEAFNQLRQQRFTETFVESAEPLCFDPLTDEDPENDDEDFVTLEDFLARWDAGTYTFIGGERAESSVGQSDLTFDLPAAPTTLAFNEITGVISWAAGNDLGECADSAELDTLVMQGDLPQHPQNVAVAAWEIVFEPDVEDGDPTGSLKFTIRVDGDIATKEVTVPAEYLSDLPADTPAKIEVGAIGDGDNATFTEVADICVNENLGC